MDEKNYPQLKEELLSAIRSVDPDAVHYEKMTDKEAADVLNRADLKGGTKERKSISTWLLLTVLDAKEFTTLTQLQATLFQSIAACESLDLSAGSIQKVLSQVFESSPNTVLNLAGLAREPAFRWEVLNLGGPVEYWDVARARAL